MLMPLAQHDSLLQGLIPLTPFSKGEEEGCHAAGWRRPSPLERGSPATWRTPAVAWYQDWEQWFGLSSLAAVECGRSVGDKTCGATSSAAWTAASWPGGSAPQSRDVLGRARVQAAAS
jgi:hypothetical protein